MINAIAPVVATAARASVPMIREMAREGVKAAGTVVVCYAALGTLAGVGFGSVYGFKKAKSAVSNLWPTKSVPSKEDLVAALAAMQASEAAKAASNGATPHAA